MDKVSKEDLQRLASEWVEKSPLNYIQADQAIQPELIGLKLYDEPIIGFASSEDPIFEEFQQPEVIGEGFCLPKYWLPEAQTVLSFFLPLSNEVRKANRKDPIWPASEWLHGRIEGQILVKNLCLYLQELFKDAGFSSCVPSLDERFWCNDQAELEKNGVIVPGFTSNWSERHIAYGCGLGTFGLSAGLITKKGIAGRFGSLITSMILLPDTRNYQHYDEYCTKCGACVHRCPVDAISLEQGKDHTLCGPFIDKTKEMYAPRYGCGKCQVAVPCEIQIPNR